MRTVRTKVYSFNELSKEAKQKAIEKHFDINVNYDWWANVYEDAKQIGLKITGFDIDRASYCDGSFMLSAAEVAQNISTNHGETCGTYKTAESFIEQWQPVYSDYMDESSDNYESKELEQKMIEMEDEFLKSLCEDYRIMLTKEYEYLTSEDAIKETIEANEYEFTADGKRF